MPASYLCRILPLLLFFVGNLAAQSGGSSVRYWPVAKAGDLQPGAVLRIDNKNRIKPVLGSDHWLDIACSTDPFRVETRTKESNLYLNYSDPFREELETYFYRPFGLSLHPWLKSIEQVMLHVTRVEETTFRNDLSTLPQVLPHLSCEGIQQVFRKALREKRAVFINKRIEAREGRLLVSWKPSPNAGERKEIEALLKQRGTPEWDETGRLVLSLRTDLPVLAGESAVDSRETGRRIGTLLKSGDCDCSRKHTRRITVRSALDIPGLVAYYPFDGDCEDIGRNGLEGVLTGGTFGPRRAGKTCADLREDGLFTIPREHSQLLNLIFNNSYTISFWLKRVDSRMAGASEQMLTLFRKSEAVTGDDPRNGFCLVRDLDKNQLIFNMDGMIGRQSEDYRVVFAPNYRNSFNGWDHYVLTVDRGNGRVLLYQNGVALKLEGERGRLHHRLRFDNTEAFTVGKKDSYEYSHRLQLDELTIFNRSFSEKEAVLLAGL